MIEPTSNKAKSVMKRADTSCTIWFVCKGNLIYTRCDFAFNQPFSFQFLFLQIQVIGLLLLIGCSQLIIQFCISRNHHNSIFLFLEREANQEKTIKPLPLLRPCNCSLSPGRTQEQYSYSSSGSSPGTSYNISDAGSLFMTEVSILLHIIQFCS